MKLLRSLPLQSFSVSALIFFSSLATSAQTAAVPARVTQAVDMQNLVTLHGNTHPLARPQYDRGAAPDSLPAERMLLVLQRSPEQEAALRELLDEQQIEASPNYHLWLTPEQFGEQFGPADADVQAVTDWLGSQGFRVNRVAAGRTAIEFSGTAGLVRQAFRTQIHKFAVNGEEHWANSSDPQIPAALAPVVAGFASLNNFPRRPLTHSLGTFRRTKATGEVEPLFTWPVACQGGTCYYVGIGPGDFATIYNVAPLWTAGTDGAGQTIAVVGETNINRLDVADFRAMFGLPVNPPNIILNGPDPGIVGDETEADLDVEWSGAVARGATIDLVVSESTETTLGIDLSALYIVDNNLAPVMSESYGACEAALGTGGNSFYNTLWEQAAAQGITVLVASGDSGSAGCDSTQLGEVAAKYGLAVSGIASTPFNVAVGGTDFNLNSSNAATYWSFANASPSMSSAKSYIPETTWNDSCAASGSVAGCTPPPSTDYLNYGLYLAAGGGGPSSCLNRTGTFSNFTCSGRYSKPPWQSGTGVPSDSARDIPDLSFFSGEGMHFGFYIICEMDANSLTGGSSWSCDLNSPYTNFQGVGGTSAAVQTFAGVMALVNQRYGRQGNANYVLYPMAAKSGASCVSNTAAVSNSNCVFYDVTLGNNSVICQGGTPNCSNTTSGSGQYGIMVSGAPAAAAYPTTTGYDLATGLGSVNVANLVNKWASNFTQSAITLSLSTSPPTNPVALTHGEPVNFTVNVTPGSGSGTPAGDVSLIAHTGGSPSGENGIGPFTLSGGSFSGTTNMLPGGTYGVVAHYAGDGTYGSSDSAPPVQVTVNPEDSQTHLAFLAFDPVTGLETNPNATSVPYGSLYILRADVTNGSGQLCFSVSYPCPTGQMAITDNGQQLDLGRYQLNGEGYTEDQYIQVMQLKVGPHNFVGSYLGDSSYNASTSAADPVTISHAPTATTVSAPSSAVVRVGLQATITTQSYGAAPAGTVQFVGNGVWLATADVWGHPGSSHAFATATAGLGANAPAGAISIQAKYMGDDRYAPSTSPATVVNVMDYSIGANPTTINISAPGQSGSSTLTVTPLNGYQGNVALYCNPGDVSLTCSISPQYLTLSGSSPVTVTLTVNTTAPVNSTSLAPQVIVPPRRRTPVRWDWLLDALLAMLALMSFGRVGKHRVAWLFAIVLLVAGLWISCGGGGGGGGGGPGTEPYVALSASSLSFSRRNLGTTSAPQSVALSNTGNAALAISSISIDGANPSDFAEANNCNSAVGVGVGCKINVTFTPSALGSRAASLVITDNAFGSPQSVSLTGTGDQEPTVSLAPAKLVFGQENMNAATAPQTVTVSNIGQAPLVISQIECGGDFLQTNNCGNTLAAGSNCAVNVRFSPVGTGVRGSNLDITDNASDSPQMIGLQGTGFPPVTSVGTHSVQVSAQDSSVPVDDHQLQLSVQMQ